VHLPAIFHDGINQTNGVSMSTNDDKTTGAAGDDGPSMNDPVNASASGKEERGPHKSVGPVILFFVLGLAASLVVGWGVFPKLLYSQKQQPIDFNHVLHVRLVASGCESCHFFREDGSFSGVAKLEQCIGCHEEQQGASADEKKFVTQYVAKGIEVPWLIYARQPECVFFSHAAHVQGAEMECATCHGPVGESEHLRVYEENRITGYSRDIWGQNIAGLKKNDWDRMKMDDCANCHAAAAQAKADKGGKPRSFQSELFGNAVNILFPNSTNIDSKSSVQTNREACFVCHK